MDVFLKRCRTVQLAEAIDEQLVYGGDLRHRHGIKHLPS